MGVYGAPFVGNSRTLVARRVGQSSLLIRDLRVRPLSVTTIVSQMIQMRMHASRAFFNALGSALSETLVR
jgi:hypothetical protein